MEAWMQQQLPVTLSHAHEVATIFKRHPLVTEVLVFGSVARNGSGNDLDLVLVVDEQTAAEFARSTTETVREEFITTAILDDIIGDFARPAYPLVGIREKIAAKILGSQFSPLIHAAQALLSSATKRRGKIDLFLLPPNWQNERKKLQDIFPQSDSSFWNNVARDAQRLVP